MGVKAKFETKQTSEIFHFCVILNGVSKRLEIREF